MTMDEITKLVDDFGRVSAVEGDADLPHSEVWIESRAALLRAVEGIERERDRAESALVARHGGEPLALLAELDEARDRADCLLSERDAASATAQRIAERLAAAEAALAAMRAHREDLVDLAKRALAFARGAEVRSWPPGHQMKRDLISKCKFILDGIVASPPPAALRESWTDCNDRKCGRCARCRGLTRDGVFASPPAALSTETDAVVACSCLETLVHHQPRCPNYGRTDGWRPTPTKSKEDPHHG